METVSKQEVCFETTAVFKTVVTGQVQHKTSTVIFLHSFVIVDVFEASVSVHRFTKNH